MLAARHGWMGARVGAVLVVGIAIALATGWLPKQQARAADKWEDLGVSDDVHIYRTSVPGTNVAGFKGVTVIEAPVGKVLWVLGDHKYRKLWTDRLDRWTVIENLQTKVTLHDVYDLPWPIDDRDFVFTAEFRKESEDRMLVHMRSIEHPDYPPNPETGVRGELHKSLFILEKLGDKRTRVTVEIVTDPRGSLPTWLVNLIQQTWPVKTLNGIRALMDKPYVKEWTLP